MKIALKLFSLSLVLVFALSSSVFLFSPAQALPVEAQSAGEDPVFLKIDGIDGESTDSAHKDEIDILSWSWGITREEKTRGSARRNSKADFHDLVVVKDIDKASPKIMEAIAKGKVLEELELSARRPAESNDYLVIMLENVMVTSYMIDQASLDDVPTEEVSFNYEKIKFSYEQMPDEDRPETHEFSWDLEGNTSF